MPERLHICKICSTFAADKDFKKKTYDLFASFIGTHLSAFGGSGPWLRVVYHCVHSDPVGLGSGRYCRVDHP